MAARGSSGRARGPPPPRPAPVERAVDMTESAMLFLPPPPLRGRVGDGGAAGEVDVNVRPSSPPAIGGHVLRRDPYALWRGAGLEEDIDGHPAPGIPVAADPQPPRRQRANQLLGDVQGAGLVEGAVVAEGIEVELQG